MALSAASTTARSPTPFLRSPASIRMMASRAGSAVSALTSSASAFWPLALRTHKRRRSENIGTVRASSSSRPSSRSTSEPVEPDHRERIVERQAGLFGKGLCALGDQPAIGTVKQDDRDARVRTAPARNRPRKLSSVPWRVVSMMRARSERCRSRQSADLDALPLPPDGGEVCAASSDGVRGCRLANRSATRRLATCINGYRSDTAFE